MEDQQQQLPELDGIGETYLGYLAITEDKLSAAILVLASELQQGMRYDLAESLNKNGIGTGK